MYTRVRRTPRAVDLVHEHVVDPKFSYTTAVYCIVAYTAVYRTRVPAVPTGCIRTKITVELQLRVTLSKVCAAKRHNVSFVGSSGFYSIFQHTDGNRPHSMACGGQHS